jgi:acetolactate synthase-1/2/3 large subunit
MERDVTGEWCGWLGDLESRRAADAGKRAAYANTARGVDPAGFISGLSRLLPDDAVYIADVGQNQMWSAANFSSKARFLTTGGMGTMGYSLPAAIGAQLARPDGLALAVAGDGAFQMSMNELATVKQLGIPIKIILMNNGVLGLVREMQTDGGQEAYAVDLTGSPDYGLIAAAYGIPYAKARDTEAALNAARVMLSSRGAYLLECVVDPAERT